MYNNYFGFHEKPFKLVPNPEYLFLSKTHEIALAHLTYAAEQGDGFVVIIGEVGTGKTTLCRNYLESLDQHTDSAYIFNPHLDSNELLAGICHEYGIRTREKGTKALLDILNEFLIKQNTADRKVVLLIDEAQLLSTENLEMVRMLSNLETTKNKLLQIILVGQPELAGKLERYELRQLAQRISLNYQITPLSAKDTEAYIQHRISIASKRYAQIFTTNACRLAFRASKGVPRLINIIADRALLVAFSQNKPKVTKSVIQTAISELDAIAPSVESQAKKPKKQYVLGLGIGIGAVVMILVALVYWNFPKNSSPTANISRQSEEKEETSTSSAESTTFKVPTDQTATKIPAQSAQEEVKKTPLPAETATNAPVDTAPPPTTDAQTQEASQGGTITAEKTVSTPVAENPTGIEALIRGLDPLESRKNSATVLFSLWQQPLTNVDLIPREVDDESFFEIAARQYGLRKYQVGGNWNLVRRIDLPAIVRLKSPVHKEYVFVSLVGIRGDTLLLKDNNTGEVNEVAQQSLMPYFGGAVYIFWKNIIGYDMIIGYGSEDRAVLMVKNLLREIGYQHIALTPEFDLDTSNVIREFQKSHQLKTDGLVGPLTKILLLREAGAANMPHLKVP